jgi:hypothetical protein
MQLLLLLSLKLNHVDAFASLVSTRLTVTLHGGDGGGSLGFGRYRLIDPCLAMFKYNSKEEKEGDDDASDVM